MTREEIRERRKEILMERYRIRRRKVHPMERLEEPAKIFMGTVTAYVFFVVLTICE